MTATRGAVLSIWLLLAALPAHAQANYFRFIVCNISPYPASVAVHGVVLGAWEVRGWYNIYSAQCADVGMFELGFVHVFARTADGRTVWDGFNQPNPRNLFLCMPYSSAFRRATLGLSDTTCPWNESLQYMSTQYVIGGASYTLMLR